MSETIYNIPCLDLKGQHSQIKNEVFEYFERVYENTAFSGGSFVEEFENGFSDYIGSKYSIAVNNGTSALHLAMLTLGIGKGDEVIIPANTFIATAWGVSYSGAIPVFVDCAEDTWEVNPLKIEEAITPKTKAVIGVHLYGQPFDIDSVLKICKAHNLFLIEDAAQAQGSRYKGKTVGVFGEIACYSFYPGKNLGACGEAGGLTTNHEKIAEHLKSLRNHGSVKRYFHDEIGFNMRMGGLEAASLIVKLKYIENWNNRRREIARLYQSKIINKKIIMQRQPEWVDSNYHLFVVTCNEKVELVKYLNEKGIFPGFHYPVPCHLQKAYSHLGYKKGDFPNSEFLAENCLSLPMFAELTNEQVNYVIETINKF
ncbi:MAG: DegT/DnrJ/EryC1/StrS family aminotransferase [Bacteroidota bacterium]